MGRNTLKLDSSAFAGLLTQLEKLGGSVREAVDDAMGQAAETIKDDTIEAVENAYLPAGGKYSTGDTRESIIADTTVRWEGNLAWVPVGFDFNKPGAGGWLISGTPRMRPDEKLHRMYREKRYMKQIHQDMQEVIMDHIQDAMGV